LARFALWPQARPQGPQVCDNNGNTSPGAYALIDNTIGSNNAAIGVAAVLDVTKNNDN